MSASAQGYVAAELARGGYQNVHDLLTLACAKHPQRPNAITENRHEHSEDRGRAHRVHVPDRDQRPGGQPRRLLLQSGTDRRSPRHRFRLRAAGQHQHELLATVAAQQRVMALQTVLHQRSEVAQYLVSGQMAPAMQSRKPSTVRVGKSTDMRRSSAGAARASWRLVLRSPWRCLARWRCGV